MSKDPKHPGAIDLSQEKIHWDFRKAMSYGDYLALPQLLASQRPLSGAHDEMLFIIMHQTSELWMKLCLHEVTAAIGQIRAGELGPAFKMLARVGKVQSTLIQGWEILATMTPFDYASFRDSLGKSSGFQSHQYRMLEFRLGNKNASMARVFEHRPEYGAVREALEAPSIYDESLALLARRGFKVPEEKLGRDFSEPYIADTSVVEVWREVYRDVKKHWDLYELAEKLVDLEYRFQLWRFSHMKTVERIIGGKPGTGGTSGVAYLKIALDLVFYPELWTVRTEV